MKEGAVGSGRVHRGKRKGKGRIRKTMMFENAIMKPTLV